jgi:hypothetical protein
MTYTFDNYANTGLISTLALNNKLDTFPGTGQIFE